MEGQSGLSELSVISWVSAIQGCPLSGVPLYPHVQGVGWYVLVYSVHREYIPYMVMYNLLCDLRRRDQWKLNKLSMFAVKVRS